MSTTKEEIIVLEPVTAIDEVVNIPVLLKDWETIPTLEADIGVKDDNYKAVKKGHLDLVSARNKVEKVRKRLKEPALSFGKLVDSKAKELKEAMADTEQKLFIERNKVEKYEQVQQQKKIDAELARQTKIENMVSDLRMVPGNAIGMDSERLTKLYETVEIPQESVFEERFDEAIEIYKDTINKLETMIETAQYAEKAEALAKEAEAKRQAEQKIIDDKAQAEREEFLREKAEFQKEKDALKAEQDAKVEAEKMKLAEQEAKEFAEQQEAEAKALQEEQEKAEAKRRKDTQAEKESRITETLDAMNKYTDNGLLLNEIIAGVIPNLYFGDMS